MSTRLRFALAALALVSGLALPDRALAAKVLFVSDSGTDLAIADALTTDGHDVMTVNRDFTSGLNLTLHGDLSIYDCVVWSATSDGSFSPHVDSAAFSNLLDFVSNGGNVFVTSYGTVGYGDTRLIEFLGGSDGSGYTGPPMVVADLDTDLTTGVVDLRGVTPTDYGSWDYDGLTGLGSDTVAIVQGSFSTDASQWSIRSVGGGHIAWVAGVSGSDSFWTDTRTGPAGAYNAALRNFVTASTGTATTPGAPRVAFNSPFSANEGDPLMVTVHVTDPEGDSVTWSWDLDGDGTYGDMLGAESVMIPEGTTDGPGDYVVHIEASDGVHTTHRARSIAIVNVAPRITSHPPSTVAIDQHVRYGLMVDDPGGAHDPPTFTLRAGPTTAIVTPDGVFDWSPTEAEITAPGTMRAVAVDVDDGDMGVVTQMWSMTVIDDHSPSDPTLLYPAMDAPILTAGAHFAIGNSSDLDGDPITYTFELDSANTFDSPDLQVSGPVADVMTGITTWSPSAATLHYGRWYWRVSASDGQVTTSPVVSSFLFVPDPTMLPDTGPVGDAGADGGSGGANMRGCGCSVAAPRAIPRSLGAFFAAIALLVSLRRRRR